MSESYTIYVSDTETTGLDKDLNEIIELSMIRLVLDGSRETEQKTWLMKALKPETIQEEALKINGHKREDILGLTAHGKESYIHPVELLPQIENWIAEDDVTSADRVLGGQNIGFDFDMLENTWKRHNAIDTFPFLAGHKRQTVDTKQLALFIDIIAGKRRKFYNLGSLVKAYGVKKEKAHRADADTRMTAELLLKQINPFKKIVIEAFPDIFVDDE
jgi:DNA polymerase III alpha subunit (gram-positive type)